jgi:hypothetical protein
VGLSRAADHIVARLSAAGLIGAGEQGAFRIHFQRSLPAPVPEACMLSVVDGPGELGEFAYGEHFVPVIGTGGQGRGEAVLFGFGIDSDAERYDDITGEVAGTVAVIVEGEPRHKRKFEGDEVTDDARLYAKLATLAEEQVAGVLVVRRPPPEPRRRDASRREPATLGFRHTWASWMGSPPDAVVELDLPVLEITPATAAAILGVDPLEIAAAVDRSGKPPRPVRSGRTVELASLCETADVPIDNVVGILPGSDPELADEYVVVGAHYDHVGVDPRGRIGFGADDNASGTAALLEIVEALATARPRRSILACAFAAEEDGLVGSRALCAELPVPRESLVAMLNLDMIGRGEPKEVVVLGIDANPGFEKLLKRANKLSSTRIKRIVTGQGRELFQRSDHYAFHEIGVPTLFFFEGLPIEQNVDYHTWRDTIEKVDLDKVERTTQLVYNVAWLLANDDERPPPPER